jgi:hypothetical protein
VWDTWRERPNVTHLVSERLTARTTSEERVEMLTKIRYHDIPGYGVSFPGVTSLIELFAEYKLIDTFIPKSETMATIGTTAHAIIARINKGGHVDENEWDTLDTKTQNAVLAFLCWQKDVGFKPRGVESLVYSLQFGIAGHPDADGICRPWYIGVFDWKLGDVHNIRTKLQVGAYGGCLAEMHPRRRRFDGFRGVHLDPLKATYEELIMSFEEGEYWFNEFIRMKMEVGIL